MDPNSGIYTQILRECGVQSNGATKNHGGIDRKFLNKFIHLRNKIYVAIKHGVKRN